MKSLTALIAAVSAYLSIVSPTLGAFFTNNIQNSAFNPFSMTIRPGDTIVWINHDLVGHTVTGNTAAEPICGFQLLSQGGMCMRTFDTEGTYPYHCEPHFTFMFGTVIVGNVAPTNSIASPANNSSFTGPTNVLITASANDPDGTITNVEFFAGTVSLGSDNISPYQVNANFALGRYILTAVVTDNEGARTTSAPVTITIISPRILDPIPQRIAKGDLSVELQVVAEGMQSPLGMAVPDDNSGRIFVYDQAGLIWVLNNGVKVATPMLDLRNRVLLLGAVGPYDERGLLGVAAHPDFANFPLIYTYTSESNGPPADFTSTATNKNHQSVIAEWRIDAGNSLRIDPSSRREVLRLDKPQFNHNGGTMRFGQDGYLYFSVGDGGNADDQGDGHIDGGNAQSLDYVLGKVLRIDVNARGSVNGQYGIPADNPFVGLPGIDEIYAYGLRNPYSFSFDKWEGTLYLGDVGQNNVEELDIITKGGNYGWNVREGAFYFDPNFDQNGYVTTMPVRDVPPNLIDPIAQYDHDEGLAIVGGYIYRGAALPELVGKYVTGDWGNFSVPSGRLFYLDTGNVFKEFRIGREDRPLGEWVKGFGEGPDGELYVCVGKTLGPVGTSGRILKIVPLPAQVQITGSQNAGGRLTTTWTGGNGPFLLQKKEALADTSWNDMTNTANSSATASVEGTSGFFRVSDTGKNSGIPLSAQLGGIFEHPAVSPSGNGFATMRIEGNQLYLDLRYSSLTSTAILAHIHGPANASVSAGVLVDLAPLNGGSWGTNGTLSGAVTLTPAQRALILDGKTYINVHTLNNGGGEIRGQIVPVLWQNFMQGLNERPSPNDTPAVGQSSMFLVGTQLTFNIVYKNLTATSLSAHIHGPGSSADSVGIFQDLMPFHNGPAARNGSFTGTIPLAPNVYTSLVDRLTYVNVHSGTFPGGEIRGQVYPKASATPLTASLSGAAERPSSVSTPGTGFGSFRLEGTNLFFEVLFTNLTSTAIAAHIHGAASSGSPAGILIDLEPYVVGSFGRFGALGGVIPLTAAQKALILGGQTYVNIHTVNNGGGEIRGQIAPVLMWAMLNGNNEVPGVPTFATGQSTLFLIGNRLTFDVTYRNMTQQATLSRIHAPAGLFASVTARVDLAPFNGGSFGISGSLVGTVTLNATSNPNTYDLGNVIDGLSYINVSSGFRSTGEIRGQILH